MAWPGRIFLASQHGLHMGKWLTIGYHRVMDFPLKMPFASFVVD